MLFDKVLVNPEKWLADVNDAINVFVWVKIGLVLLIGTGVLMTCATKFFQVTHIPHWWKKTIGSIFAKDSVTTKKTDNKTISQFQSLFGAKGVKVYKVFFVLMIVSGSVMTSSLAWDISDTFNGLMMIPNLIGVVSLMPLVAKITKNYVSRQISGKDEAAILSFDPAIEAEMKDKED